MALLLLLAAGALALILPAYLHNREVWREIHRHQRHLLYETDHKRLLGACHEFWQRSRASGDDIVPNDSTLPGAITELSAHMVYCHPTGVTIEMGGQGCHWGFEAQFAGPQSEADQELWMHGFPSRQLSPGFWYYAENGLVEP